MPKIPFISTPDKALTSSTQDFITIADIVDGVVIYKNGGAALVMESTSLNFGLLSQIEQEAVIAAYAGLMNSFNFPVQIVVRSKKKDITNYMRFLSQAEKNIKNPQLSKMMKAYKEFIKEAIKKKNVLSKSFYIIIPFTPYELGVAKSMTTALNPSKSATLPFPKSYVIRKAKIALYPKRDHLMRQAGRLGIVFRPLSNDELIQLMYDIYNPEKPVKDKGDVI
jgi:hypothetical protein